MPEENASTLNHFALYAFQDEYWALDADARSGVLQAWRADLRSAAQVVTYYQATEPSADVVVWSALPAEAPEAAALFFEALARADNTQHRWLRQVHALWGFTHPSQYSKARSAQEMDPFDPERKRYLVIYPFVKTAEWYLLGRETRQGMMNEHIRIGKQYEEIRQLLLYSFGLQDQEFVVVYETDNLRRFSDLVHELRSADGRLYTLRDTPLHAAVYVPDDQVLKRWQ